MKPYGFTCYCSPVLSTSLAYGDIDLRHRFYAKIEVMDDILTGMMEDLIENDSFDESQKEEQSCRILES